MRHHNRLGLITKSTAGVEKSFQMRFLEVKASDDGSSIRIKGFASTPDIDRYDDIVNPAAFANAMTLYMKNPVVLLGHDANKVLGRVIEYNLTDKGLEVTAELTNDIDATFKNIMDKNLRGFSIGFICKGYNVIDKDDRSIREITSLDLVEISVVSTPANASALFTMAKSFRLVLDEMESKGVGLEIKSGEGEGNGDGNEGNGDGNEGGEPPKTEPKTGEEGEGGENPPPRNEDGSGDGKNEPVKVGENPEETPKGMTEEQVKALIDTAVQAAVKPLEDAKTALEAEIKSLKEAITKTAGDHEELHKNFSETRTEFKKLEEDFLNVEIRPGQTFNKKTSPTQTRQPIVTDSHVFSTFGR